MIGDKTGINVPGVGHVTYNDAQTVASVVKAGNVGNGFTVNGTQYTAAQCQAISDALAQSHVDGSYDLAAQQQQADVSATNTAAEHAPNKYNAMSLAELEALVPAASKAVVDEDARQRKVGGFNNTAPTGPAYTFAAICKAILKKGGKVDPKYMPDLSVNAHFNPIDHPK